jgi:hypothetical protein
MLFPAPAHELTALRDAPLDRGQGRGARGEGLPAAYQIEVDVTVERPDTEVSSAGAAPG